MSHYLNYAIQLAEMVEGQTGVNPPVGAVVVNHGRVVGLGAHLRQGDKHAEVQALDMAGAEAQGGTIYISLEPCTHYGSTPPCVNKIIDFGISKVVYAIKDTTLSSRGDQILKEHGIEVEFRYQESAMRLYEDFFFAKRNAMPEVTVKVSCSLDGKQATDVGQSQWITNKAVKQDVFQLRHTHDAVITGNGTVHADDPSYTTRIEDGKHPVRVLLSKSGEINFDLSMFQDATAPIWIYTENPNLSAKQEHIDIIYLEECTVERILSDLYSKGIGRVLVEAGPQVTSQFLHSTLTKELILYYAPIIIGGSGQHQFYQTDEVLELSQVPNFEIVRTDMLEQNIKVQLRKK
ncbi:bifunctional diaminohydroxyphosphoribosylaminopyrimidine deaminase/5-amino-6-(5-phosphoribosylamino)uracil reductase RibD [Staphylococcus pettenkoferi]|uniref:bifunctional diaminohydroxyphosphoribosylaminopyrimidine deaminase/5-amino-6-(5-phosphoribosylamino)uracil reductase RibD n=1 Tax=Staphylococcus pettenkoferi TaxID=170573 RepID=UPI0025533AA1|nr:bifunctional diaminohydroxyphosphoribosylaminopyrimidine deaminase/5-amino-6-(5-phosphoribosylamino)uracil reductase RibD [Staphylococcus pettenkoferi]MDK7113557.1 bifunctional diaminohydroxyphosphoribosylaminopyrimidine deaminase/5-amino-6-(5-phosphoribosylamino)uracil reductase RibD [Staphylococcus pettenkoferi]